MNKIFKMIDGNEAVASILLEKGEKYLQSIISQMETWMEEHEYKSISQIKKFVYVCIKAL